MRAILIQQGLGTALQEKEEDSTSVNEKERAEIYEKAQCAIIMCLGDKSLREVAREKYALAMWTKLESI